MVFVENHAVSSWYRLRELMKKIKWNKSTCLQILPLSVSEQLSDQWCQCLLIFSDLFTRGCLNQTICESILVTYVITHLIDPVFSADIKQDPSAARF